MRNPLVKTLYVTTFTFAAWIAVDGAFSAVSSTGSGSGSGSGGGCTSDQLLPEVKKVIQEQEQKGHHCVSGFRTHEEQQALWDKNGGKNDGAVAPPGHSCHEKGCAADWGEVFEPTPLIRLKNAAHENNTHGSTTGT